MGNMGQHGPTWASVCPWANMGSMAQHGLTWGAWHDFEYCETDSDLVFLWWLDAGRQVITDTAIYIYTYTITYIHRY